MEEIFPPQVVEKRHSCSCGKKYVYRSGLNKHRKKKNWQHIQHEFEYCNEKIEDPESILMKEIRKDMTSTFVNQTIDFLEKQKM